MTSQGGFPHPEGRNDKPESASLPCHCEEGASPTWESRGGSCAFADGFPTIRPGTARLPRLLRSLAMTNLIACFTRRGAMTKLRVFCSL